MYQVARISGVCQDETMLRLLGIKDPKDKTSKAPEHRIKSQRRRPRTWAALALCVLVAVLAYLSYLRFVQHRPWLDRTGFESKAWWDVLQLLIVPAVLVVGGWWLSRSERQHEHRLAARREEAEKRLAEDRQNQSALDSYFDRITELLLHEELRVSASGAEVRNIARARTLAIVEVLDPVRRGQVVRFLYESGLIQGPDPVIRLEGANLEKAAISKVQAASTAGETGWSVDLRGANLRGVNLKGAQMMGINLEAADLTGASLEKAFLFTAKLSDAILRGTDLSGAMLAHADLTRAEFTPPLPLTETGQIRRQGLWRDRRQPVQEFTLEMRTLTSFEAATLVFATLDHCDLTLVILDKAHLHMAHLRYTDLREALLQDADLSGADLTGAAINPEIPHKVHSLSGATMPNGIPYEEWEKQQVPIKETKA
jgi:uncharacterized protein YjbI with pentapeptide repeats